MANILIIDDEKSIRKTLTEILTYEGYKVDEAADGMEGFKMFQAKSYDAVLCDIKMPKMDGLEFLEKAREVNGDIPIIMVSGHGNIDTAVDAVKKGAYDYISKPPDLNRLLITLRNAMDKTTLVTETKTLRRKVNKVPEMIGQSSPILKIKETIEKVAPTDARVLITGDNGVGKELVARWLHERSNRAAGPMVEVNCAAIPGELIESELFGHEKGSFTSAVKQRIGKFEQASGGTLFLDEIGDMSLSAQAKVLRALQEGKITRVGGDKEISVDVRVVAATNKDLLQEVENKNFRLDLYHRLSVILIHVPSLNDRRDDVPLLVDSFLDSVCSEYGITRKVADKEAMKALQNHNWTGNIRELRNVVERLVILSGKTITAEDVDDFVVPSRDKRKVSS
ncbi:DNA-binding transcriptional response regulator, NtrC family, contains REC, AAA-type ATPase, and a Fis-type DNA-binding domains [Chitinophaga ginsengisegetis]|uniref:DNA-binding transcriptional response regulator, NtrC family, contains REC, AAA-type ATPase, and a Fis-type DNA-binding domains n=1 Tax=Chitinophaga ginsengisegetis TaxID=393003 RepID=A0A1T5NGW1_9BACT|nr:sigma-54 dependent transcriptional regulator [Chitinophaga ginsengisegetis]MDR6569522.1 DNA-binding NtrC family response regulator [Chitinophaga ginsengisegetis]MDR6649255.1 DNA-binding NtrC family response regulator [Chitinophaga ginsengisegetis]MDR6655605.1 DNA-binding NtrC family response regulator [Chitinophaga ginsengisegetis]SKC99636.1 DNA-binding transcriptional response regulator, NtrC family, contains REC, AAA-type ATPase, and a Fis-type DNA-binding domains [Chitinophaga ginsengiseg